MFCRKMKVLDGDSSERLVTILKILGNWLLILTLKNVNSVKINTYLNIIFFGLDFGVKINTLKTFILKGFSVFKFAFYSC